MPNRIFLRCLDLLKYIYIKAISIGLLDGYSLIHSSQSSKQFTPVLIDPNLLVDNNQIENAVRPLAIGRKNYLFAGSHEAAQRAAMLYSFMGTCKKNGVNPFEWLRDILIRIPEHRANKLDELLPQNWVNSTKSPDSGT